MEHVKEIAKETRLEVLKMIHDAQVSHVGSNFSAIDILTVLYENSDFKKDKLIVSKGWIAATIYSLNVRYGLMPQEAVDTYCQPGSKYIGLIEPLGYWGCEFAGGSVGMGLPFGVGAALAKKMKGEEGTVYVLLGDGDLNCGMTWESALIAAHHKLDNLVVIVDNNSYQAMGKTDDVLNVGVYSELCNKFSRFDWITTVCMGHDFDGIEREINWLNGLEYKFPKILIASTTKGKGVSFMAGNNDWHYLHLDKEHYEKARKELEDA